MHRASSCMMLVHYLIAFSILVGAHAIPPSIRGPINDLTRRLDEDLPSLPFPKLPNPLAERKAKHRNAALLQKLASQKNTVAEDPQYKSEEITQEREIIWNVLAEFSNLEHNQIPEPDRAIDNVNFWKSDFDVSHYDRNLFATDGPSMTTYYDEQSGGLIRVDGVVEDWVSVSKGYAYYGNNDCGDVVCESAREIVKDGVNAWYQSRIEMGWSLDEINDYLAQFDENDRYDWNGNGDLKEPDYYIDHMQIIHAGVGEELGGGEQGTDAIWSHRWYTNYTNEGIEGPSKGGKLGGVRIGESDYWVGDYFTAPENGGLGVFVYALARDFDLPDLNNRQDVVGKRNGVGFWSVMAMGSYGNSGRPEDGLENLPTGFGPLERLTMGWADYQIVDYGEEMSLRLRPASQKQGMYPQVAMLRLPKKIVEFDLGEAYSGQYMFYSTSGNDIDVSMTRKVTLVANKKSTLSAQVRYDIEEDWDYAFFTVNGEDVSTSESRSEDPNGNNPDGVGITGNSNGWKSLTVDLSDWAGEEVEIGFRYWTDEFFINLGFFVDNIEIDGVFFDDVETGGNEWSLDGFIATKQFLEKEYDHYYLAEYRAYVGYDDSLRTGPFNIHAFRNDKRTWVERFPYQEGLLIWYWDTSFEDNDVSYHCDVEKRCGGMILPIDSHPEVLYDDTGAISVTPPGKAYNAEVCSYDATFSAKKTPKVNQYGFKFGKMKGAKKFDDEGDCYVDGNWPYYGAFPPETGTRIEVADVGEDYLDVTINKRMRGERSGKGSRSRKGSRSKGGSRSKQSCGPRY